MFRSLLAAMAAFALVPATSMAAIHTVAPGETLWGIAYANNLPTSAVAAANGLSTEARVVAGTNLTIPAPGQAPTPPVTPVPSSPGTTTAPAATGGGGYQVQAGDTLTAIAARQGVSLGSLAAANGLKLDSWVIQGTTLKLPAPGSAPVAQAAPATGQAAPEAMGAYKVRPGDTLTGLAAASRVPAAQMAYMNGLNPTAQLIAGTIIKLPTGAAITPTAPAPARTIVPQAAPMASPGAPERRTGRHARRPVRRPVVAGRRHRVAGERVQQRDDLPRQRARRHAGHARHVELGPGQPQPGAPGSVLADRQRQGRLALPRPPAARDRRRSGRWPPPATTRAWRRCGASGCCPRPAATWPTCWPSAGASAADRRTDRAGRAPRGRSGTAGASPARPRSGRWTSGPPRGP